MKIMCETSCATRNERDFEGFGRRFIMVCPALYLFGNIHTHIINTCSFSITSIVRLFWYFCFIYYYYCCCQQLLILSYVLGTYPILLLTNSTIYDTIYKEGDNFSAKHIKTNWKNEATAQWNTTWRNRQSFSCIWLYSGKAKAE